MKERYRIPGVLVVAGVLLFLSLPVPPVDAAGVPRMSAKCRKILYNRDKGRGEFLRGKVTGRSRIDSLRCYQKQLNRAAKRATGRSRRGIEKKKKQVTRQLRQHVRLHRLRKYNYTGRWYAELDLSPSTWSIYTLSHNRQNDLLTGTILTNTGRTATIVGAVNFSKVVTFEVHPYPGGGTCPGRMRRIDVEGMRIECDRQWMDAVKTD